MRITIIMLLLPLLATSAPILVPRHYLHLPKGTQHITLDEVSGKVNAFSEDGNFLGQVPNLRS